ISKSLIFSQKGCTPHPAPPTRQKLPLFAFRGSASLSPLLAKNRHSHYCSFAPDFLHHEAGEIKGASHELDFNLDCHDLTSSNLAMTKKIQKNAESSTKSQNLNAESNSQNTHPLAPSAREGGFLCESAHIFEGEQNADSANETKIAESNIKTQNLKMDCHDLTSSNLAMTDLDSSLRTSASRENDKKTQNLKIDCHDSATQNLAMTDNSADSANEIKNAESTLKTQNLKIDCHDFATQNLAMTENDTLDSANRTKIAHSRTKNAHSANQIKITHPRKIHALLGKKFRTEEYFLHIKSAYKIDGQSGGMVLFVAFGAYYAPSNAYFLISENHIEALSDIIPTRANIEAINLLMEHLGD
ncbi:hypothetical protein ACWIUD_10690, partial [Helicobacter sp. 23-1044]